VVLDKDARSWFIADSSLRGYDGGQNVRYEERSVGRKKWVRKPESERRIVWPRWTGLRGKTVWDWMDLLIVPLMLVALGFWVTTQQDARQQRTEERRADQAQHLENQRSQDTALQAYFDSTTNLLIDEHGTQLRKLNPDTKVQSLIQARTETLFEILDKSREVTVVLFLARSDLIPKGDPLISLAGIDLSFIDFRGIDLSVTNLAASNLAHAILTNVNLSGADLSNANLAEAVLISADFSAMEKEGEDIIHLTADLTRANLREASLQEADLAECTLDEATLTDATLQRANLSSASLRAADLSHATLQNADLSSAESIANLEDPPLWVLKEEATNLTDANLSHAALQGADLSSAVLQNTNLTNAKLTDANLTDAKGLTREQLSAARSLEGATMPNGQKYEDWLKE
jgi:uncharacterized protein YjbI with pentapeptide repeats